MTIADFKREHYYRVSERIGIMAGSDQPTVEQEVLARREADEAIESLREKIEVQSEML